MLRALGWKRKLRLGPWFRIVFQALYRFRFLRGTPFDPFGHTKVRSTERHLIGEYRSLIERTLTCLRTDNYDRAVDVARPVEAIRGYEHIELTSLDDWRRDVGA